jgi:Sec-independent protein translocase protein TatA
MFAPLPSLAFIENLSFTEIIIVAVVAVLVFGGKLPEAAGQAAAQLQRLRRQLSDLRRDSGIDREIDAVRRTMDQLPRMPRTLDIAERLAREGERSAQPPPPPAPAPSAPVPLPEQASATPATPLPHPESPADAATDR